jgi:hypothetical protein
MITRLAGLADRLTHGCAVLALTLAIVTSFTLVTSAQESRNDKTGPVETSNASSPANLFAHLAEEHPSVRSLIVARPNCIAFEYYRKTRRRRDPIAGIFHYQKRALHPGRHCHRRGFFAPRRKAARIFPDEFDENVDPQARDISVRDILTKTEGFAEIGPGDFKISASVSGKPQAWRWMINRKVGYPAGSHFRYDFAGSDLLSVVLSHAIKQDAWDFAKQKLFDPLGITNYIWYADSESYLHGEFGLNLTARDMMKIGVLVLQQGRWNDRQIVSESYVREATTRHNDGGPPVNTAYGYQWWISKSVPGAFFASGIKGQLIYVVPQHDFVLTVSADSSAWGGQAYFNNVVLPAAAELARSAPCIDGHETVN